MTDTKRTIIKTNEGELVMKRTWDENTNVKMIIVSPSIETIEDDCFKNNNERKRVLYVRTFFMWR